jgi:hypothetical protein
VYKEADLEARIDEKDQGFKYFISLRDGGIIFD